MICMAGLVFACATPSDYKPQAMDAFLIDDTDQTTDATDADSSMVLVERVDGKAVTVEDRLRIIGVGAGERGVLALKLSEGTHSLHVKICETGLWVYCSKAYLKLEAKRGHYYRLNAKMSKRNKYADVWVVDLKSGDIVIKPIRVRGFTRHG